MQSTWPFLLHHLKPVCLLRTVSTVLVLAVVSGQSGATTQTCSSSALASIGIAGMRTIASATESARQDLLKRGSVEIRRFSEQSVRHNIDVRNCRPLKKATASCYGVGDNFNGKPMANGIPFDTTMMTAAHPTAKLDSKLVVFSPDSKRAFEVMVTDRGPSDSMQKKGRGSICPRARLIR